MDKGEENAASEEKAHILTENERSSTEEYLPELEKKEKEYVIKNIQWTTGNDFTVERGQQQIEEYISTWEIHESWLHWSEFLREEELKYSKRYYYRVRWSVPTRRKPIPRATASVYFIIEISKTKPAVSTHQFLKDSRVLGGFQRQGNTRTAERPARSQQLS
ncbi:A-kinase anchor protein 14 isoform 2-T2 [Chlamydotis macqueenii]